MPTTEDIRAAIEAGDKQLARRLYDEVLAKREGKGLSGHDQQVLSRTISRIPPAPNRDFRGRFRRQG